MEWHFAELLGALVAHVGALVSADALALLVGALLFAVLLVKLHRKR